MISTIISFFCGAICSIFGTCYAGYIIKKREERKLEEWRREIKNIDKEVKLEFAPGYAEWMARMMRQEGVDRRHYN